MTTTTPTVPDPRHLVLWRKEAEENIVVICPQGAGGSGDAVVCISVPAEGDNPARSFEVARFSSWAALVTREGVVDAAEAYAAELRQRYVDLATGIPGFGRRR